MRMYFWGVPACCAAQSACYGLRYRFGALHHAAHALRMPNAKEVFFMGFSGLPAHPPTSKNEVKNTSFYTCVRVYTRIRVRDSSGKPAVSVANEDLQRIARPRSDSEGDTPKK
jgi:hypothetical protein